MAITICIMMAIYFFLEAIMKTIIARIRALLHLNYKVETVVHKPAQIILPDHTIQIRNKFGIRHIDAQQAIDDGYRISSIGDIYRVSTNNHWEF
jgi:hypothetical protein